MDLIFKYYKGDLVYRDTDDILYIYYNTILIKMWHSLKELVWYTQFSKYLPTFRDLFEH